MSTPERLIERHIYDTFSEVAASLGYSPLHGKIIAALIVHGKPMRLQELAQATGYSPSMVSLSLDLLEVLNIIKKVKKTADRKLSVLEEQLQRLERYVTLLAKIKLP